MREILDIEAGASLRVSAMPGLLDLLAAIRTHKASGLREMYRRLSWLWCWLGWLEEEVELVDCLNARSGDRQRAAGAGARAAP
jgi:hypothetical protein